MTTVLISGWKIGFEKVKFTRLLQTVLGSSLSQARRTTDTILSGGTVELQVSDTDAQNLVAAMDILGAKCAAAVATSR